MKVRIMSKKKAVKKSTPKPKANSHAKPVKAAKPKQTPMFDTEISDIERLAEDYAEARDNRQEYLNQEVQIKDELMSAMKSAKKTDYVRNGIEIHIVHESEKLKVKIHKDKDDGEAAVAAADGV